MKKPILVVLAAGMGSRYGGLKQMDKIGASGEALLDYSVFDALRAGFGKIIFIIRSDIESDFNEIVLKRMGNKFSYELAFQEPDTLIPANIVEGAKKLNRTKPWGTAHALLCAKDSIDAPFAVINADDFYGKDAYVVLAKYLSSDKVTNAAIVPYPLGKTLSPTGTVTRGICKIEEGYLLSVEETMSLAMDADGFVYNTEKDGSKQKFAADTPVSMNFWGFPKEILPHYENYFNAFLEKEALMGPKTECFIPRAADEFIKKGIIKVKALNCDSEWFGVTYKEDKEPTVRRIAELTQAGIYPPSLWS